MHKQSPRCVLPEEGVLQMCCEFSEVYLCVGVILIKLQSGFVEIALLRCCFPVGLLHVWGTSSFENKSGGVTSVYLLKIVYTILDLFFLIKYTFEDFQASVLLLVYVNCCVDFYLMVP